MITLQLLEACENCQDFDPVRTQDWELLDINKVEYHHTISCSNINKCKALLKHLTKEVNKNGNEENGRIN